MLPKAVIEFNLGCSNVKCVPFNTNVCLINKFDIYCGHLTKAFGDIISAHFPKLAELRLSGKISENINILLNNDSLGTVTLTSMKGKFGFTFKSGIQPELKHYLCEGDKTTNGTYDDIKGLPNLSFTSFKEKTLKISDSIEIFSVKETT